MRLLTGIIQPAGSHLRFSASSRQRPASSLWPLPFASVARHLSLLRGAALRPQNTRTLYRFLPPKSAPSAFADPAGGSFVRLKACLAAERSERLLLLQAPLLYFGSHRSFHTSPMRMDPVTSWLVVRAANLALVVALIAGRRSRRWFHRQRDDKKQNVYAYLGGLSVLTTFLILANQWAHTEYNPVTQRNQAFLFKDSTVIDATEVEEDAMLRAYAHQILPPSHPSYARVSRVLKQLVGASYDMFSHSQPLETQHWRVTLVDSDEIQAFVSSRRHVFVFRGLLEMCPNDDRLACVLSHELTHCLLYHPREKLSRLKVIQSVMVVAMFATWMIIPSDLVAFVYTALVQMSILYFLNLPFSRMLETEADRAGIYLAARSCYDVREAEVFWGIFDATWKANLDTKMDMLWKWSSHPSYEQRLKDIEVELRNATLYPKACPPLSSQDPRDVLIKIREEAARMKRAGRKTDQTWLRYLSKVGSGSSSWGTLVSDPMALPTGYPGGGLLKKLKQPATHAQLRTLANIKLDSTKKAASSGIRLPEGASKLMGSTGKVKEGSQKEDIKEIIEAVKRIVRSIVP